MDLSLIKVEGNDPPQREDPPLVDPLLPDVEGESSPQRDVPLLVVIGGEDISLVMDELECTSWRGFGDEPVATRKRLRLGRTEVAFELEEDDDCWVPLPLDKLESVGLCGAANAQATTAKQNAMNTNFIVFEFLDNR